MPPPSPARPCHRCLQPVPLGVRRCPNCGDFQKADARRLTLILAIAGVLLILFIVGVGLSLTPAMHDTDNQVDNPPAEPAPKPAKKPPLD